jgi:hypothetical protein
MGGVKAYGIPNPAGRAMWVAQSVAEYADAEQTRALLRDQSVDLSRRLILPLEARSPGSARVVSPTTSVGGGAPSVRYRRVSTDQIELDVEAPTPGFARVLEAYDIGWRATVNGAPAKIWPAHQMAMAVAVPAGTSLVRLEFFTPGRDAGLLMSLGSVAGVVILAAWMGRSGVAGQAASGEELAHERADPVA